MTLGSGWSVGLGIGLAKCKDSVWAVGQVCQAHGSSSVPGYDSQSHSEKSGSDGHGQAPVLLEEGVARPFMDTQGISTKGLQLRSAADLGVAPRVSPYRPAHP